MTPLKQTCSISESAGNSASAYPEWLFDDTPIDDPFGYGDRAVRFLRALKHPKSLLPNHTFQLDPPFERIVRAIYGPRHPDGRRIVRTVAIMMPRGNRKTSLGAGLALLHTIGPENMAGGECMVAASDRSQARIAYLEAYSIIEAIPDLPGKVRMTDSKNRIKNPKTGAFFEAMSADGRVAHGHTPVFALVDEIHAWPKRDLWEAIKSGLVKVPNSLLMVISTAGRGQENLAWEFYDYARKVARGEVVDPTWLPILFETDRDADWLDEDVWFRANPGLRYGYPDIDGLRQLAREAKEIPTERAAFQQLNLNMWLDRSTEPFVDMLVWDEGNGAVDLDELEADQAPCWLGCDLSSVSDLTAIAAAWPDGSGGIALHVWFFCPEEGLRLKADREGVPYPTWSEDNHITPIPGEVIDHRVIEDFIRELCARFNVQEIAFDPHLARVMMSNLAEEGLPAIEMKQSWAILAPAINEFERVILGRKLRHGGNPVLRWNIDNIAVTTDRAGNRMFNKSKSRNKIDGAVASAMAIARAVAGDTGRSSYDTFDGNLDEWAFA
jgi:phage terminase large subunit-like protein